jgi:hypothetical protein
LEFDLDRRRGSLLVRRTKADATAAAMIDRLVHHAQVPALKAIPTASAAETSRAPPPTTELHGRRPSQVPQLDYLSTGSTAQPSTGLDDAHIRIRGVPRSFLSSLRAQPAQGSNGPRTRGSSSPTSSSTRSFGAAEARGTAPNWSRPGLFAH